MKYRRPKQRRTRTNSNRRAHHAGVWWAAGAVTWLTVHACGCAQPSRAFDAQPVVTFADFGLPEETGIEDEFRVSEAAAADVRFPMRVAVVRVRPADTACRRQRPPLILDAIEGIDGPPWSQLIINLPAVSEVFFLQSAQFPRNEISIGQIAGAAGRFGAGLCLVYAESDLEGGGARVIGALFDPQTSQVVSTLSATHEPQLHGYPVDRPPDRAEGDERHTDSRHLARAKFRGLVHDCLLTLIEEADGEATARAPDPTGASIAPPRTPVGQL